MTTSRRFFSITLAVLAPFATLPTTNRALALIIASDNASNPAYAADATNGAWQGQNANPAFENPAGNDNGGTGFLPWDFTGGYAAGPVAPYNTLTHFIDGVDFPTTQYNHIGTPAFGLGNAGIPYDYDYTAARRPFAQPMAVGDVFSVAINTPVFDDSYAEGEFPAVYIELWDSTNAKTVGFWTAAQPTDGFDYGWTYTDKNHAAVPFPGIDSSLFANNGATMTFKLTSATTGHVTVGNVGLDVDLIGGAPTSVFFEMGENNSVADGSGNPTGDNAFYFNNLKIERTALAGDYNNDGKVDAADYVLWRNDPASYGGAPNGYTTWRANFGSTSGSGSGLGSASQVPEPSCLLLAIVTGSSCLMRRKCR